MGNNPTCNGCNWSNNPAICRQCPAERTEKVSGGTIRVKEVSGQGAGVKKATEGIQRVELTVYGNPVAQGRPKFFRRGNHVGCYDPQKSKEWKETIKGQAIRQGATVMDGALNMTLEFYMSRPKTLPKKVLHHTKKPDVDNLVKAVKDALKGICYRDDAQVVTLYATKNYHMTPHVRIVVYGMGDMQ